MSSGADTLLKKAQKTEARKEELEVDLAYLEKKFEFSSFSQADEALYQNLRLELGRVRLQLESFFL